MSRSMRPHRSFANAWDYGDGEPYVKRAAIIVASAETVIPKSTSESNIEDAVNACVDVAGTEATNVPGTMTEGLRMREAAKRAVHLALDYMTGKGER